MSRPPSNCPRCLERLNELGTAAPVAFCPRCGFALTEQKAPEVAAPKAAGSGFSWRWVVVGLALTVIGGAGVVIVQKVVGLATLEVTEAKVDAAKGAETKGAATWSVTVKPPEGTEATRAVVVAKTTKVKQAEDQALNEDESAPPKNGAGAPKDESASWSHSRLVVIRPGQGKDTPAVVALSRPRGVTDPKQTRGTQKGLLAREIVRQALLMAARDEMGLPTRDEVLGDVVAEGKGDPSADFGMLLRLDGPASVRVAQGDEAKGVLLDEALRPSSPQHELIDLAGAAEHMSRSEFPKLLKALGATGQPIPALGDGGVPAAVEEQLDGLGLVGPLAALRAIHAAIRTDGESPARLGALVRGYARLGVLNEPLWTPAHKVFKARAFLYAQRLIARDPNSPWAFWHRAYAEALAGLHRRALDDLAEAERLSRNIGKEAVKIPAWVDTLSAYCHFDLARVKAQMVGPQAKLAGLLRLLMLEFPHHSDVALHAATELLQVEPECFRAHEVMYRVGGVSNLHVATMFAPQVLSEVVPQRIRALGDLPQGVREAIDKGGNEPALVVALELAGKPGEDAGEPSWGVLGALVRETRFVQVQHRLVFMTRWWGVPTEEFWDEARPLVARHCFTPYLLTMAIPTQQADKAFAEAFEESWVPDLELSAEPMVSKLSQVGATAKHRPAWSLVQLHMDHLVRDFAVQCDLFGNPSDRVQVHNANKILMLSPENLYAMSLLIESDWKAIQPRLADWEKKGADFLPLVAALGRQYSTLKQYDKANALLERYIKASPEHWAFERLAKNYKEQGDNAQWLAMLDRYLATGEDHGLEQAKVRVEIADFYMDQGLWEKARPYAEAAAETWAAWAMLSATRCFEGLKDWEKAELWVRRVSERYPGSSLRAWLLFCQRTGHGDAAAAQSLIDQYVAAAGDPAPARAKGAGAGAGGVAAAGKAGAGPGPMQAGLSAWLEGSTKKAIESLRTAYTTTNPFVAGCALAVLADEQGDTATRDQLLGELCEKNKGRAPKMVAVLQLFRDAFARGDQAVPESKVLDDAVSSISPNLRGNTEFFVGWLLRKRAKREVAEVYLKRCLETPTTNVWLKRIAEDAMKRANAEAAPAKADPAVAR